MSSQIKSAYRQTARAIDEAAQNAGRSAREVTLVAVSKTQVPDNIKQVLLVGHRIFGENRVQEAQSKWPILRADYPDIELHLIGPLQSNKVAEAVALFDVIETVDREKIAVALAAEMKKQGKSPRLLVQVNTGEEPQKAGIFPSVLKAFLHQLKTVHGLTITGLMCIPPQSDSPTKHFSMLRQLGRQAGLATLSMGMSADYAEAIAEGATHVRIGSAIFGSRPAALPDKAKPPT